MIDQKEVMAKKVQAVARGYISRKNMAGDQKTGKAQGGGDHTVKPGDATHNEEAQAKIIQGAFRKYKGSSKKN